MQGLRTSPPCRFSCPIAVVAFSQNFGPGPFAGSLSQNLTPGDVFFFSLTAVSVELAMLPACDPSLSITCALSKTSKALQRVLVVPAWQGTLHGNNLGKKNSHDEVLHRAWSNRAKNRSLHEAAFKPQT